MKAYLMRDRPPRWWDARRAQKWSAMYRVVLGIVLATLFTSVAACGASQNPNPNSAGPGAASSSESPAEERSVDKMR